MIMSNKIYYLYVKTHNITGMKYLGKTVFNPWKYKGSGKYWKRHIKKYSNDVTTKIIGEYNNIHQIKKAGRYYSQLWNVVKSNEWANLIPEYGEGGGWNKGLTWKELGYDTSIFGTFGKTNPAKRPEVREKIRQQKLNKPRSNITKEKLSNLHSIPIKVTFQNNKQVIFKNRLKLGIYLHKSKPLGAKLFKTPRLWNKYKIKTKIKFFE